MARALLKEVRDHVAACVCCIPPFRMHGAGGALHFVLQISLMCIAIAKAHMVKPTGMNTWIIHTSMEVCIVALPSRWEC